MTAMARGMPSAMTRRLEGETFPFGTRSPSRARPLYAVPRRALTLACPSFPSQPALHQRMHNRSGRGKRLARRRSLSLAALVLPVDPHLDVHPIFVAHLLRQVSLDPHNAQSSLPLCCRDAEARAAGRSRLVNFPTDAERAQGIAGVSGGGPPAPGTCSRRPPAPPPAGAAGAGNDTDDNADDGADDGYNDSDDDVPMAPRRPTPAIMRSDSEEVVAARQAEANKFRGVSLANRSSALADCASPPLLPSRSSASCAPPVTCSCDSYTWRC